MDAIISILIIIISSVALIKGMGLFIKSSTQLAHHFKISGYTISFFLIAVGTSLPETVVAITSSLQNNSILAFGNAMGSNIALITLVIAIAAILGTGISTRTILNSKDIYYTALFSLLPMGLIIDGVLSRIDGLILLTGYSIYTLAVLRRATGLESLLGRIEDVRVLKQFGLFIFGLSILLGASGLMVNAAINLSTELSLGLGFIGLTITAVGTSLPEIAYSIAIVKKGEKDQILGDIVGSVVANSTLVLGIAALIRPINLQNSKIGAPTLFFLVLSLLVFLRFARTKEKLDTKEGVALLGIYILFVAVEFMATQGSIEIGF